MTRNRVNSEVDEELNQLVEEKIEEKMQKLRQEQQHKEIPTHEQEEQKDTEVNVRQKGWEKKKLSQMTRRDFIKAIFLGSAGVGAAATMPQAAALDIKDSSGLTVEADGNEQLDIDDNQVNVRDTFSMNRNKIDDVTELIVNRISQNDTDFTLLEEKGGDIFFYLPRRTEDPSNPNDGQTWVRTDTMEIRTQIGGTIYRTDQLTSTEIPDSGASHQWNFISDEISGRTVEDAGTDGGLDAEFTGSLEIRSGEGVGGEYAYLDGICGTFPNGGRNTLNYFQNTGVGTAFGWMYLDGTSTHGIFFDGNSSTSEDGLMGRMRDGRLNSVQIKTSSGRALRVDPEYNIPLGKWIVVTYTFDGNDGYVYVAEPDDGYELTEVGSGSISGLTSGETNIDHILYGGDGGSIAREWVGGVSLTFADDEYWSKSELQNFVDKTKHLYE